MIDWDHIDTVLLDMDGTLLDLYFDNHFWLEHLPAHYAEIHNINLASAKAQLYEQFKEHQGTLNWYCLDFWSETLNIDVAALKQDVAHLISPRPNAVTFLQNIRASGRRAILVTNAHRKSLELKLKHTEIEDHLDIIISSHDFGLPKEDMLFWDVLARETPYDERKTLLIDDSLAVLRSAKLAGIGHTLAIMKPDSKKPIIDTQEFVSLDCFSSIMPPPLTGPA
ncbi:haloacid dehalogenase [Gammaproteobacteria bacterium 45_16_T64]|nr:haloacid dehalogenase [Gammaproteobacteria bacterium 45_16_T64]